MSSITDSGEGWSGVRKRAEHRRSGVRKRAVSDRGKERSKKKSSIADRGKEWSGVRKRAVLLTEVRGGQE
ncbi:MAG: hypothetical protein IPI39_18685 [Candidatus Obscuribacter sp.]|nr:hypothetical protein [Candidatus Obscuribacter sp.]